ncbi:2-dehydropantoate 2-reductase [Fulvivirga ulvae]|uniref:ketopantoate reductase family protein n=1 Tax=Fulvivirga ulvae TaxID=2904245 RepID=UPI001F2BDB16|nr:2-dehydropantoate 2-reductase [Fulvivirga ulvae]UII32040.1 2-dehydropantoate 2-reductase [Fulvivirga ulvae]
MKKIAIAGIGGIGGFIGVSLAKNYHKSKQEEIIFICRNETKEAIVQNGLTLESAAGTLTVLPHRVADAPEEIGILDVLILACKSYSLESIIKAYESCIGDDTVVITLQNVVNGKELIRQYLNKGRIIEGCIYVASNVKNPGYIQHVGGPGKIFIGGESHNDYRWLMDLLVKGGLDITFEENIKGVLWKKYLFVAPVAAITTAYNISFGELSANRHLMDVLKNMMVEIQLLAEKEGILLSDDDVSTSYHMLSKFPYSAKSSLQLDVESGKASEKKFLVDYVMEQSARHALVTPFYNEVNERILSLA